MEEIMETMIDENTKSYLVACLVAGIDVIEVPRILMNDIVGHLNRAERQFWAEGDEDGVVVHDNMDVPFMHLRYDGKTLKFGIFDLDEQSVFTSNKMVGFALLNIIGYLQNDAYEFSPSIFKSDVFTVDKKESNIDPEDWAL